MLFVLKIFLSLIVIAMLLNFIIGENWILWTAWFGFGFAWVDRWFHILPIDRSDEHRLTGMIGFGIAWVFFTYVLSVGGLFDNWF
tara:strand:- start:230 stop:484 length:255 start_codon:yes stop_codon:yes gene_type:complete